MNNDLDKSEPRIFREAETLWQNIQPPTLPADARRHALSQFAGLKGSAMDRRTGPLWLSLLRPAIAPVACLAALSGGISVGLHTTTAHAIEQEFAQAATFSLEVFSK